MVQELLSNVGSSLTVEFALAVLESVALSVEHRLLKKQVSTLQMGCLRCLLVHRISIDSLEEGHFIVIPLLLKANSCQKNPCLHTKLLVEMYWEIVLGPKWWSCVFFPDSWVWFILCILLMAALQNYFLTKIHCFWQLSGSFLLPQKIYGSVLMDSRQLNQWVQSDISREGSSL